MNKNVFSGLLRAFTASTGKENAKLTISWGHSLPVLPRKTFCCLCHCFTYAIKIQKGQLCTFGQSLNTVTVHECFFYILFPLNSFTGKHIQTRNIHLVECPETLILKVNHVKNVTHSTQGLKSFGNNSFWTVSHNSIILYFDNNVNYLCTPFIHACRFT